MIVGIRSFCAVLSLFLLFLSTFVLQPVRYHGHMVGCGGVVVKSSRKHLNLSEHHYYDLGIYNPSGLEVWRDVSLIIFHFCIEKTLFIWMHTHPEITFDSSEICLLFARRDWMSGGVKQLSALHREAQTSRPMSARYHVHIWHQTHIPYGPFPPLFQSKKFGWSFPGVLREFG